MRDTSPVTISELIPEAAADWQSLANGHVREMVISRTIVATVSSAIFGVIHYLGVDSSLPMWMGFAVIASVYGLSVWHAFKSFKHKGYALRNSEILYRHGIWWRSATIIPLSRAQHVETERGPLERQLGLAKLKVFTAGSGAGDLEIPGLELGEAERLRAFVVKRIEETV